MNMQTRNNGCRRLGTALALSSALVWAPGCGVSVDTQAQGNTDIQTATPEALIGGFAADSEELDALASLAVEDPWGIPNADGEIPYVTYCSGVVIGPRTVMTARHCAFPDYAVQLFIGPDGFAPRHRIAVSGWTFLDDEPLYPWTPVRDIAFAILAEDAPVLPLSPKVLGEEDIGTVYVSAGHGIRNNDAESGLRRVGSLTLRALQGRVMEIAFGDLDSFLEAVPRIPDLADLSTQELESLYETWELQTGAEAMVGGAIGDAQACFGDSGGGLVRSVDGQLSVFGVTSWGIGSNTLMCDFFTVVATLDAETLERAEREIGCPGIPLAGTCSDPTTAVRCTEANEGPYRPVVTDCAELGQICLSDGLQVYCDDDPCEGISQAGQCVGNVASRCTEENEGLRRLVTMDCTLLGQACAVDGEGNAVCMANELQ